MGIETKDYPAENESTKFFLDWYQGLSRNDVILHRWSIFELFKYRLNALEILHSEEADEKMASMYQVFTWHRAAIGYQPLAGDELSLMRLRLDRRINHRYRRGLRVTHW